MKYRNTLTICLSLLLFASCDDILEVPDISDASLTLLAPTEGAIVRGNTTTFSWEGVEDADDYLLQIATPNFANASQILLDTAVTRLNFTQPLLPNAYEWRLKARNSGFETSFETRAFTVLESDSFAGNTVILVNPANNTATNRENVNLTWQPVSGAVDYRIQVLGNANEVLLDEVTSNANIELTFSEGRFTWQVRAQNATESTLYSQRILTVDITEPNTPTLTAPGDNSNVSGTSISFSWNRTDVAGSSERDSIYIYSDEQLQNLVSRGRGTNKAFTATLDANTYYWFVQAFDLAGNSSEASSTFQFTNN
ncbi:hypothetical protein ACJD0Z_04305 [Flavobacteriaceae bacterium M23B6Z8]